MTSQESSRPRPQADQDNVPGSQHGDTAQDEGSATDQGGPGADPTLPETAGESQNDDDGEPGD